jgi:hypothetical protein
MRRVNPTNARTEADPNDPPGFRAEVFRFGVDPYLRESHP